VIQVIQLMLIFAVLFLIHQHGIRVLTCRYCGQKNGHDENCPFGHGGIR
jgi:hypothetical protein